MRAVRSRDAAVVAAANPHRLDAEELVAAVRNTQQWADPALRKSVKVEADKRDTVSFTFRTDGKGGYGDVTLKGIQDVFAKAIAELREEKKILLVYRETSVFRNGSCVMEYNYHP